MKIKEGFILSKVGGDTVAVASGNLSKTFSGVVVLNGSGAFLWNVLASGGGTDEKGLLSALLDEYEIDESTARADIGLFIDKLSAAGIIERQ
jgi:hypothetical protein